MDRETLLITCHNEDDGNVAEIEAEHEDDVGMIVVAMYELFHLERQSGDRLRCEATGDDVFAHLEDKLEAYQATRCRDLVWVFSSDQGGATR